VALTQGGVHGCAVLELRMRHVCTMVLRFQVSMRRRGWLGCRL